MATKGQERMTFVPSPPPGALDQIQKIRDAVAALIDMIDSTISGDAEVERLKALAMTALEEASMWATKAITRAR